MKLQRAFLRSKVARRIVVLFVLSSLVPIAATAIISLGEVQKLLVDQAHLRLAQANESYATSLLDRLLTMNQETIDVADRVGEELGKRSPLALRMRQHFKAIVVIDAAGHAESLFGPDILLPPLDAPAIEHLAQGKATLTSLLPEVGSTRVLLRRAIDAGHPNRGSVVAEIDPGYLWGDDTALPAVTDICVSNEHGRQLYCSGAGLFNNGDRDSLGDEQKALKQFTFTNAGEVQIADRRELFLKATFLARGWSVLAVKPEAEVLKPLTSFRAMFVPILVLTILVVSLVSVTQVRRMAGPLEELIAGTRRASNKDFTTRVAVSTNDEFGELARAFNTMSTRLGNQFEVLATLAEIDRAILSRLDLQRIVETVALRIGSVVAVDFVSVVIRDRDTPDSLRVYTRGPLEGAGVDIERCQCVVSRIDRLRFHPNGLWLDGAHADEPYLKAIKRYSPRSVCVFPVLWQDEVVGAIVLGFRSDERPETDVTATTRDLGDRLGVAFAAAVKEEQLYYQANYDPLTSLANRHYFKDQLGKTLSQAKRDDVRLALLFIDLDHFKKINDTLGHAAGDEVLRQTAERLKRCVRDADTIARLGGDEFTVIATQVRTQRDPESIARHILDALRVPFVVTSGEHFLSASIGIAVYPADGATADDLIRNADTAMYRAKDGGRDRFVYFEETMNAANREWMTLDRDLRYALERHEFELVYQPQKDVRAERIVGAEALLRWRHPERGLLTPLQFIDVAETTGQIEAIGDWVLQEACRQFNAWESRGLVLSTLAVNVSARQFRRSAFADRVDTIIRSSGMRPGTIELEITESLLLETGRGIEQELEQLRQHGVRLALDDFGTGYSSLAYLKRFDVGTVKIDRAFIQGIPDDKSSAAIVKAIIAMSHALGKCVVAEGVETATQYAYLAQAGCDMAQGYFIGRGVSPDEFDTLFSASHVSLSGKSVVHA